MNAPVMPNAVLVNDQRSLFHANRRPLDPVGYEALYRYEANWIAGELQASLPEQTIASWQELREKIDQMCRFAADNPTPAVEFVASHANRAEFSAMVQDFAVDALTEAQSFLPFLPRLPHAAQMPLMRIFIDEFGCGNLQRMHSRLYAVLLEELGCDTDLAPHVANGAEDVFAFVNVFHYLARRELRPELFLGALMWFESVVPVFFAPWVAACQRLGIAAHAYYTEHIHIDPYHAEAALLACRETARVMPFDYTAAWHGARLVERITDRAFETVVARAQNRAGGQA